MIEPTESSFVKYLPAIFQQRDDSPNGKSLANFLLPFEQVLSEFEILLSGIDHYYDPKNTPERFLPWLASWVALELDDKWDEEKKRDQIAKAIGLYRRRGTVEGLKQSIAVYDPDLQVSVVEQAMPGGMQIGVASRIGGFDKGNLSGERLLIQQMQREEPVYYDYYVVEMELQPDQVGQSDPIRFYYRTDRVDGICVGRADKKYPAKCESPHFQVSVEHDDELNISQVSTNLRKEFELGGRALSANARVDVDQEGKKWTIEDGNSKYLILRRDQPAQTLDVYDAVNFVSLTLTTGATKYHEPATVTRLHKVAHTRYSLTVNDGDDQFVGDTFVVDHAEQPFQFIVDIEIPTDWLFRFEMDLFEPKLDLQPFLEESLVKAIGDLLDQLKVATIDQSKIKEAVPGRQWTVITSRGEWFVERTGWTLHMSGKPGEAPMVMLQAHDFNFEAIATALQQKLVDQGASFPSEPKPWWEPDGHRWLKIGNVDSPPAYLAMRRGSRLFVYQFVGDAKWRGVTEPHELAEDGSQPKSQPPDISRAIHAIVDDVKPSHTQYTLRFGRKTGPQQLPALPIESRLIATLKKLTLPHTYDPVRVPEDLRNELAKHHILLSDGCTVRNATETLWRIDDKDAHPLYITLRGDEALDVHQRSLIDETMIIG